MLKKKHPSNPSVLDPLDPFLSVPCFPSRCLVALGFVPFPRVPVLCDPHGCHCAVPQREGGASPPGFLRRALRVRKKMSGEKMPVKMIGDILSAQLPHMQPYIRFCSCQLNGAALIQQKTDEAPDFKEFVKVRSWGCTETSPGGRGCIPRERGLRY